MRLATLQFLVLLKSINYNCANNYSVRVIFVCSFPSGKKFILSSRLFRCRIKGTRISHCRFYPVPAEFRIHVWNATRTSIPTYIISNKAFRFHDDHRFNFFSFLSFMIDWVEISILGDFMYFTNKYDISCIIIFCILDILKFNIQYILRKELWFWKIMMWKQYVLMNLIIFCI